MAAFVTGDTFRPFAAREWLLIQEKIVGGAFCESAIGRKKQRYPRDSEVPGAEPGVTFPRWGKPQNANESSVAALCT